MTDLDPDVQRARAIDAITHLLAGRLLPGMDAAHIAAQALDIAAEHGARFVARPGGIPEPGRKDPAVYDRGGEYARELLARRKPGPYRPTEGDTDA